MASLDRIANSPIPPATVASGAAPTGPPTDYPIETPAVAASPITDHYDTATCADWKATDPTDREVVALYYANEFGDPQPVQDADSLVQLITTVCSSYGTRETPRDAAKVSIATVYGTP